MSAGQTSPVPLHETAEVAEARASGRPLVALETSVVAQGLPYPENVRCARACEEAVRAAGAVPVPIAVLDGRVCLGLEDPDLERLARGGPGVQKLTARDLALALTTGASGGTTVSASLTLAHLLGLRVFATGGIGGVHRVHRGSDGSHEAPSGLDVSLDLFTLARIPVAVVSAGIKSVLDVPRTFEALEALGVPVIGVGVRELPGFYTRRTGIALEHSVRDAGQAAVVARMHLEGLAGRGGLLFTVPPPEAHALDAADLEPVIEAALREAAHEGVKGKGVTPFLLAALAARTGGRTLAVNLELLTQNARFAGELAVALGSPG